MLKKILVIPEFNEAPTIIDVLERADRFADLVVVVNDGSSDNSGFLISQWSADRPKVRLLTLPENRGMSAALLVGFAYVARLMRDGFLSPDDIIINIDADGQHLPEEIPQAVAVMISQKADVLLGRRDLSGYPWFKVVGNWGLSLWASLLSGHRYYDVECGFRLMKVKVATDLIQYFLGLRYGCAQEIAIITAQRGWRISNRFPTQVAYYRPGARIRDGFTNLIMGLLAFGRVFLGLRRRLDQRLDSILSQVVAS